MYYSFYYDSACKYTINNLFKRNFYYFCNLYFIYNTNNYKCIFNH